MFTEILAGVNLQTVNSAALHTGEGCEIGESTTGLWVEVLSVCLRSVKISVQGRGWLDGLLCIRCRQCRMSN